MYILILKYYHFWDAKLSFLNYYRKDRMQNSDAWQAISSHFSSDHLLAFKLMKLNWPWFPIWDHDFPSAIQFQNAGFTKILYVQIHRGVSSKEGKLACAPAIPSSMSPEIAIDKHTILGWWHTHISSVNIYSCYEQPNWGEGEILKM